MLTDRQRRAITAALHVAGRHQLALGGNAALAAHGLPGFSAKRADLVTTLDTFKHTGKAAKAVEKELRRAGYTPERIDTNAELRRLLLPAPGTLAQWRVPVVGRHDHPPLAIDGGTTTRYWCGQCNDKVYLELSCAPRSREPVKTPLGPVLHVEDAAGSRVRDLAGRAAVRDYADVGRLLEHWSPAQLTSFARRLDPALSPRDLQAAAGRLAAMPDIAFTAMGRLRPEEVPRLRQKFANWQRDLARQEPGREHPGREDRQRPGPALRRDRTPGQRALRDLYFDQQERYFTRRAQDATDGAARQNAQRAVEAVRADRDAAHASDERHDRSKQARQHEAERGEPQQRPVPAQARAEPARQRKAGHSEPERER